MEKRPVGTDEKTKPHTLRGRCVRTSAISAAEGGLSSGVGPPGPPEAQTRVMKLTPSPYGPNPFYASCLKSHLPLDSRILKPILTKQIKQTPCGFKSFLYKKAKDKTISNGHELQKQSVSET